MDFTFSPEQEELRRAVRDLAADRGGPAVLRAAMDSALGYDDGLWRLVAELGLAGLAVAEPAGGAGGTFVDLAVALEESGRALLPVPLLPTAVAAAAAPAAGDLLAAVTGAAAVATLAAGEVTVDGGAAGPARVTGRLDHVVAGAEAQWVVVAGTDRLVVVPTGSPAVRVEERPTLDPTRRQATLHLDGAGAEVAGGPGEAARAVDLLRVALAVEAVGVMRWCLATSVDHLETRVQFDRPIGSFQALQHRAADLVVLVESSASAAYYAAWAAAHAPEELPVVAPLALAVCADAASRVAGEAIQLHGGIGFTWEHDVHLYFKRATASRLLLGDTHEQRRLVAARRH